MAQTQNVVLLKLLRNDPGQNGLVIGHEVALWGLTARLPLRLLELLHDLKQSRNVVISYFL